MSLALSYAKALFETATEQGLTHHDLAHLQKNLESFQQAVSSSKQSQVVFFGPLVTVKQKEKIVNDISEALKTHPLATRFVGLLVRKNRTQFLPEMIDQFEKLRVESSGAVSGELVSADQVEEVEVNQIKELFKKRLGKEVQFRVKTNPELIAGMKITVGGVTYDGTLRSKLQKMRDKLEGLSTH